MKDLWIRTADQRMVDPIQYTIGGRPIADILITGEASHETD